MGLGGSSPPGLSRGQAGPPTAGLGEPPWVLVGGRCRAAGPGRCDVRRGRVLAQVDKAGENRNPWSGGRVAGTRRALQVRAGPGWGLLGAAGGC